MIRLPAGISTQANPPIPWMGEALKASPLASVGIFAESFDTVSLSKATREQRQSPMGEGFRQSQGNFRRRGILTPAPLCGTPGGLNFRQNERPKGNASGCEPT